jgi:hypothetical protein
MRADVVKGRDVGMIQCGSGARLLLEACEAFVIERQTGRQDLDRHFASESRVSRAIHLAHAAGTERRDDFIWAETIAWGEAHEAEPLWTEEAGPKDRPYSSLIYG